LVCGRVEINTTRMCCEIVEVCCCDLANAADCDRRVSVRRSAQLVVEINVRNFPEQLVLGTHSIAAAAGTDLQVKMAEHVPVWRGSPSLHKQCGSLQLVGGR